MTARLIEALLRVLQKYPRRVIGLSLLLCLAAGALLPLAHVDLSFIGIVDERMPLIARYRAQSARINLAGRLVLLLDGAPKNLDAALPDVQHKLRASPLVAEVARLDGRQLIADHWLPWALPRAQFDALIQGIIQASSTGSLELPDVQIDVQATATAFHAQHRLLLVQMRDDPLRKPMGETGFAELQRLTRAIAATHGVEAHYAGTAAVAQEDQEHILGRMRLLTPVSLLLVLLVLQFVVRRGILVLLVAGPMLLAVVATLGLVALITGKIIMIETLFGVLVFGLGIDFALHLLVRLREQQAAGDDLPTATATTLRTTGASVIAGALTTIGAFAVVACAPDLVALHLGLSGALGLSICLALMLTLLPASWLMLKNKAAGPRPSRLEIPLLAALARLAHNRPKTTLLVAALLWVGALAGSGRFHFERDLTRVFKRDLQAVRTMHRIQDLYGVNGTPWMVLVDDPAELRRVDAGLRKLGLFSEVQSLARIMPADAAQRWQILKSLRAEFAEQREVLRVLSYLSTEEQQAKMRPADRLLAALQQAQASGPPNLSALDSALRLLFTSDDGGLLISAHPAKPSLDAEQIRKERLAIETLTPEPFGPGLLIETLLLGDHPWLSTVVLAILLLVLLVLSLDLRSPRWVLLAVAPVIFGCGATFGLMCWLDFSFSTMTVLVVPLIIGLGVDDGIHVVHRLREDPAAGAAVAAARVAQAITLTTLTTCLSFATLLFTDHPGLESMAKVLLIGLPLCLLATVMLVPALAALVGPCKRTGEPVAKSRPAHA